MTTLDGAVDLARDRGLVERCQAGDETAFADLYARYRQRLHRFCLRKLHAPDDADEAVQESFAKAWRALPRFGGERRFYPWLTVIAANVCTDILRRRSRTVPMDEMPLRALEATGTDVDDGLIRSVDLAMAVEALGKLSDRHQRVLQLREATQLSAQRIAEQEGLAVPAVDTLLWRARQAFKREFAALSEAGGLGAFVGIVAGPFRRTASRIAARLASWMPGPTRGPGAFAAAALAGAAAVGGVALVAFAPAPAGPRAAHPALLSPGAAPHTPTASVAGAARGPVTTGTRGRGSTDAAGGGGAVFRSPSAPAVPPTAAAGPVTSTVHGILTGVVGLLPGPGAGRPGAGTLGPLPRVTSSAGAKALTAVTAAVTRLTTAAATAAAAVPTSVTAVLTPPKGLPPSSGTGSPLP